eukprot:gb/GEZJ01007286.1/.p1 GENE.gb/GEZJ01007286.1/~~gb/GEZJ01007286.1/.p1  ORF type:complete len:237 (-),score=12.09 gb/GEZJ01007286.1/:830-1540(-)
MKYIPVLNEIYNVIGSAHVTRKKMDCRPQQIMDNAVDEELENVWMGAYVEVPECTVPPNANVISSHVVYIVKSEERDKKYMKARLCPHGNRDKAKRDIRNDSANEQFDIIRILLYFSLILQFHLGCVDVKGAYLQSGPISRDLYGRPPRESKGKRSTLCKVVKLPYWTSEAGRQLSTVIKSWLLSEAKFHPVFGVSQLYIRRRTDGGIKILLAKPTDDLLFSASELDMQEFSDEIH